MKRDYTWLFVFRCSCNRSVGVFVLHLLSNVAMFAFISVLKADCFRRRHSLLFSSLFVVVFMLLIKFFEDKEDVMTKLRVT